MSSGQTRNSIKKLAESQLSKLSSVSPPINIYEAIALEGIELVFKKFRPHVSGCYEDHPVSGPGIGIRINDSKPRQRFTAAHELKHHLLDGAGFNCYERSSKKIEQMAQLFAAELLMPSDLVHSMYKEMGIEANIPSMAQVFGVSYEAMAIKVKTLGIISEAKLKYLLSKLGRLSENNKHKFFKAGVSEMIFDNEVQFIQDRLGRNNIPICRSCHWRSKSHNDVGVCWHCGEGFDRLFEERMFFV